jgi:7,8-dihydroneopterin aldolase/epimerase/oxygenase
VTTITLSGLRAFGYHGVLDEERQRGQVFVVDATVTLAEHPRDDVAGTVNYAALADRYVALIASEPVDLIETVAARLADATMALDQVAAVTVTVHKPHAPIAHRFDDVSVTVSRP